MDDTDWTATGLFSPSKAKLAQAQAKDWNFIDAWLAKKYVSTRVPAFERNVDSLEALLAIASLNKAADERQHVVDRVEKAALQYYAKQKSSEHGQALYTSITDHLYQAGHASIETLAIASLLLNTPVKNGIDELASAAIALQMQVFETQEAAKSAQGRVSALETEHERLVEKLAHLQQSDAYKTPDSLVEDTAKWLKGTKHLRAKIGEYDERLTAARPSQPLLSLIEEVGIAVKESVAHRQRLQEISVEVEAQQNFTSQPVAAAGRLLKQAKEELLRLSAVRDELLDRHPGSA